MTTIKKMSDVLSNMIAAGEVVESPSNVVKELVENAIDAHATHIVISLKDHGLTDIRVQDDGDGMHPDDARLACVRHATSKVYEAKDLQSISSLGFRGEALAAIASVSVLTIETKTQDIEAIKLTYEAGKLTKESSVAKNRGTTITVSSLFYNTPARFKFLSSDYQHQRQLRQLFYQLSLSHPSIAFTLIEDEKTFKQTTGSGDVKKVMYELFGSSYAKDLIKIDSLIQHTNVTIYMLPPDIHVSHKNFMYTFINQRYVRHYAIQDGVLNGFDGLLMVKRYPVCLVYVTIDPTRVDVNIHPQKLQVKLSNEQVLKYHIESEIKNHFNTQPRRIIKPLEQAPEYQIQDMSFESLFENEVQQDVRKKLPDMHYLDMLAGTYGLFQHNNGLALMDAHAAQERIRYEHYKEVYQKDFDVITERLFAYPLSFDKNTYEDMLKRKDVFKSYGIIITEEGIKAHPKAIRERDLELAVDYIFQAHQNNQSYHLSELKDLLAKDVSCKGSIKANQRINRSEMIHLYEQLQTCEMPYSCPHGRPTLIMLTYYDIEKMFKRVVS